MNNQLEQPIFITGVPRSGTSLIAGILNICGAFGGNMSTNKSKAMNSNSATKAMYENSRIRNEIVKPYLQNMNVDPKGQYPLPDPDNLVIPRDWAERVENVLFAEGYDGKSQVFYKGAKMCLIHPVWSYAFPNAKWIIVRRRTGDIINSCMNTGFMNAYAREDVQKAVGVENERDGWLWWIHQHEKRFREMIESGLNCKVVWPERAVNGDYAQLMEMIDWVNLEWDSKVFDYLEPRLFHSRQKGHT